jgi:hypothetical protein
MNLVSERSKNPPDTAGKIISSSNLENNSQREEGV